MVSQSLRPFSHNSYTELINFHCQSLRPCKLGNVHADYHLRPNYSTELFHFHYPIGSKYDIICPITITTPPITPTCRLAFFQAIQHHVDLGGWNLSLFTQICSLRIDLYHFSCYTVKHLTEKLLHVLEMGKSLSHPFEWYISENQPSLSLPWTKVLWLVESK